MSSMDNVENPPNTYYASYGEPIRVVEDHEEELHNEENVDFRLQGHPPETWDVPTAKQMMPTDIQMANNQEYVQKDEVCDSQ